MLTLLEPPAGIEPALTAYRAAVLPLYDGGTTRECHRDTRGRDISSTILLRPIPSKASPPAPYVLMAYRALCSVVLGYRLDCRQPSKPPSSLVGLRWRGVRDSNPAHHCRPMQPVPRLVTCRRCASRAAPSKTSSATRRIAVRRWAGACWRIRTARRRGW